MKQMVTIKPPELGIYAVLDQKLLAKLEPIIALTRYVEDIQISILKMLNRLVTTLNSQVDAESAITIELIAKFRDTSICYNVSSLHKFVGKPKSTWPDVSSLHKFVSDILSVLGNGKHPFEIVFGNGNKISSDVSCELTCSLLERGVFYRSGLNLTQEILNTVSSQSEYVPKYLSQEHIVMYLLGKMKQFKYNSAALTTLKYFGLVDPKPFDSPPRLTEKGEKVLEEMDKIDPLTLPRLMETFAKNIIKIDVGYTPTKALSLENQSPLYDFKVREGFWDESAGTTEKGRAWLLKHIEFLTKKWKDPSTLRLLVPYMLLEHLPNVLTHVDEYVRKAARNRYEELTRE